MTKRRGEPPSDLARLRLFVALVDEYDKLTDAFPIENERQFRIGGVPRPRDPQDRWHRIVRVMALRKFTMAAGDHVYVEQVIDSIRTLIAGTKYAEDPTVLDGYAEVLGQVGKIGMFDDRSGFDVVEDLTYGLYLHGDYDRWERIKGLPDDFAAHPIWELAVQSASLIRSLRYLIVQMVEKEMLPPLDSDQDHGASATSA